MKAIILAVMLLVSGCTPYGRMGILGGYDEQRINATTYRVTAAGNGYTSQARVLDILRLRCAEVTREAGYDYFEVVEQRMETEPGGVLFEGRTRGHLTPTYGGGYDYEETYSPPVKGGDKHGAVAIIRLSRGTQPLNGFDAREVIKLLRPRLVIE